MLLGMGTVAAKLKINKKQEAELIRLSKSPSLSRKLSERAKMVLMTSQGYQVQEIADELETYPNKVIFWRERFRAQGVRGLEDSVRTGRPAKHREDLWGRIVKILEKSPPKGYATWNGELIAKELDINVHAVWKLLRKHGVSLERHRSWCVSTDPQFAAKAADIVGLYLNPPQKALILCVDEKPSIQALERKTGYVYTSNKKIVNGYKSTYKRHGTINLFAALEVATGKIKARTSDSKRREEFLAFMDSIVEEYGRDLEIHVVLDNYSTHKRNDTWLKKNPNVFFHFTPTSASWLNMIEIWFGILTRKSLRGFSATSPSDIAHQIAAFVEHTNANPTPFTWRKREVKNGQIKNTIENLSN